MNISKQKKTLSKIQFINNIFCFLLITTSFNTILASDTILDTSEAIDETIEFRYEVTDRKNDVGLLYTIPFAKFGFYVDDMPIDASQDFNNSLNRLFQLTDNDFIETSLTNNRLQVTSATGYLRKISDEDKAFVYQNLFERTEQCMDFLSPTEQEQVEDYLLNTQGVGFDDFEDDAIRLGKPVVDKMYDFYLSTLCRKETYDYQFNPFVAEYLKNHIKSLFEAGTSQDIIFKTSLYSLSRVFEKLYLSTEESIYIRIARAMVIQRFRNFEDDITAIPSLISLRELETPQFANYMEFVADSTLLKSLKTEIIKSCEQQTCRSILEPDFSINDCFIEPTLYLIEGFSTEKHLIVNESINEFDN